MNTDAAIGCLLGTAAGDALGLPYEGLSPRRAAKLFPDTSRHHLLFGKGLVSDDTEHACFVAQALIRSRGDIDEFQRQLARSLRWWLLTLPAGVGFATLRAILKLWLGIAPNHSGVFSAGNGPAMRSPLLGVAFGHDPALLQAYVKTSTEMTHTDPKARFGALAVALATHHGASRGDLSSREYLHELHALLADEPATEFLGLVERAAESARTAESVSDFAAGIGSRNGISGYSYHTVPCVLQTWFRHGDDFEAGLQAIIKAGGDADTAGAIYGGIVGARVGAAGIPETWLADIADWPRSIGWIRQLGQTTADSISNEADARCPGYFVPGILPRNLVFLTVVLAHGFRRLAPPY